MHNYKYIDMKKNFFAFVLVLLCSVAAFAQKKIVEVYVSPSPRMHCESCENKVRKALQFEKGMKDLRIDVEQNVIFLAFDRTKTSLEKLATKLESLGYKIEIVDPDTLPESDHNKDDACCGHEKNSSCLSVKKK